MGYESHNRAMQTLLNDMHRRFNDRADIDGTIDPNQPQPGQLSGRQIALKQAIEAVVSSFGKFDQTDGPDGASYEPDSENDEQDEGIACANCAWFLSSTCAIVEGMIQSGGVCKFWLIPASKINDDDVHETPMDRDAMNTFTGPANYPGGEL